MFSQVKTVSVPEDAQGPVYFDPARVFVFATETDAKAFVDSFSTQVVAKKKTLPTGIPPASTLNQALKKQLDGGPKKFKPVAPRKSAMDAKVDAELANFKTSAEIEAQIKSIDDQIALDQSNQEERLAKKTKVLHENIKYYGAKVQELLSEIVARQPYNPYTGEANTLTSTIKQLGIDAEKIKFSAEDEDFVKF